MVVFQNLWPLTIGRSILEKLLASVASSAKEQRKHFILERLSARRLAPSSCSSLISLTFPFMDSAKRYERMMKAHGIHPTCPTARETPFPVKPNDQPSADALKKRKFDQFADVTNNPMDDDEGLFRAKTELGAILIKDEPSATGTGYPLADMSQYPTLQGGGGGVGNDSYRSNEANVFSDFVQSGAFGQIFAETAPSFPTESNSVGYGDMMTCGPSEAPRNPNEIILILD